MVTRARAVTVAAAALLMVALAAAPVAAANGTVGTRETVCADSLFVRTTAGGAWTGTLYAGQTFLVEGPSSGGYIYGFAYGYINRHGWVQDGWFC